MMRFLKALGLAYGIMLLLILIGAVFYTVTGRNTGSSSFLEFASEILKSSTSVFILVAVAGRNFYKTLLLKKTHQTIEFQIQLSLADKV